jgi:protein-S-isoprenylcysteine O-methyltransferase Ste14
MLKRVLVFTYGVACYGVFFVTFLYAMGFVGNLVVPKSIDSPATIAFMPALAIDILLLGIFAVQHSVMARPWFKRWWTRIVPEAAERSTYVLFASLALIALFVYWQPLGGVVWELKHPAAVTLAYTVFGLGFGMVLAATFLINHFDLFGLRQVSLYLVGRPYTALSFRTPFFYRYVRHPLYVGWLLTFWSAPTMTAAHLLFAVMTTAYILVAIQFEEHDLVAAHGETYASYRKQVPMIIPSVRPLPSAPVTAAPLAPADSGGYGGGYSRSKYTSR